MVKHLIVFDMDGVIVEVTESYRATIQATVKHFTGQEPSRPEIQDWKNRGGWNDDWQLSHALIKERGGSQSYEEVVDYFQKLFLGENNDGMITREEWVAQPGLFERLAHNNALAVFTGRLNSEARLTLDRFDCGLFPTIIGSDEVTALKPNPEGLNKIRAAIPHEQCWYIGDTVDDARAGKAAGVPFIGIAAPANPRYEELVRLLQAEGAVAVLDDINFLETVIAPNS